MKRKKKKAPMRKQVVAKPRYHDMRLVWLVMGLALVFIGIRGVLHVCLGLPFCNTVGVNEKGNYAVEISNEKIENFEMVLMIFEMFAGLIAICFFDEEPPGDGKNYRAEDHPGSILLMNFVVMLFPVILTVGTYIWWAVYIVVMLVLAVYIGRVTGFGLPMGQEQTKHLLGAAKGITVNYKYGFKMTFPGYSSIWFVAICMIGLFILLTYFFMQI